MKKYKTLPNRKGIRKHLVSGKYEASKRIKGKLFTRTFNKVSDAIHWRNTFNPFESDTESRSRDKLTFEELWVRYEDMYFAAVERSTQGMKKQKVGVFMRHLHGICVYDITPTYLDLILKKCKKDALSDPTSKRYNFNKALDELKAVFNWYRENFDYKFHNPILKRHYTLGIIRKTRKKEKVLNQEQLIYFIKAIDHPVFQDFAIVQFFCASRFGEVAGIQLKNIDLRNHALLIKEVVVEDQSKKFLELKPYPKNGHSRTVSISSDIFRLAIERRLNNIKDGCSYLFHIDGSPLRYRHVQYRYNKALKRIGLFPEYSSTHFMRYTMASESRRVMGTLDAAQAITGHHSVKMAEQYAKIPSKLQSETISEVGNSLSLNWTQIENLVIH